MKRVQIQLDEFTYEMLRQRAFQERRSLAATVRRLLRQALEGPPEKADLKSFTFIGIAASGKRDRASERHDEILGQEQW